MPFFSFSLNKSSANIPFDDEPSLPGAWASVWSLSHQQQSTPDQSTNGQPHLGNECDLHESIRNVPCNQSARNSVDCSDDMSLLSEEYHSLDSHQDSEMGHSPHHIIQPGDTSKCQLPESSIIPPKDLSKDVTKCVDNGSQLPTSPSSHSSIRTPDPDFTTSPEMIFAAPRSSSCLLGIPEHPAPTSSSSSRENSIYSEYPRSLTTDSSSDGSDTNSLHSEHPNPNQAHLLSSTSTIELQEPRQHTFLSQLSVTSSLAPPSVSSPPNSFQVLDFAQPDGDNSWTLALDPALGSHELSSQASSSSLATTSSSINTQSTPPVTETPISSSSSRFNDTTPPQSKTAKEPPRRLFLRERVVSTPYRTQASSSFVRDNASSTPTRPSFGESIIVTPTGGYAYGGPSREHFPRPEPPYSPYSFPQSTEEKSKTVLRKTKAVVTKIKQLFNAKSGKNKLRDGEYPPRSSMSPTSPLPAPPSPMSMTFSSGNNSLHRTISPPTSVYQSFGMPRAVKLSAPSVTFPSSLHDSNSNLNLEDTVAHEYYTRPKNDMRSKRRFSLPSVLAGSGGRSTPSSSKLNFTNNNSTTRIGSRPAPTRRNGSNVLA
ncbi:hypothetical protein CVT24_011595 [Panaeolus cyanescens]|uniref:Uncharacterized protein n=1 Tax=Panaeolus cyanescens TaxID=181874 RepID=A0A409YV50_9AGAR|nr:hypothetical protein CVT24_011595 [Panaeolus cyanescens]